MTHLSPLRIHQSASPSILFVLPILFGGLSCSSTNGIDGTSGGSGGFVVNGSGGNTAGGAGSNLSGPWPPTGFTNVTAATIGDYALGPEVTPASGSGSGTTTIGGVGSTCSGLYGLVRDFQAANQPGGHPDFEYVNGDDKGIVTAILGTDGKPVYGNHPNGTATTHNKTYFDQWYRDTLGVNRTFVLALHSVQANGVATFQADEFFPLDGQGFGNQGNPHNFHFTSEIHTSFTYNGGETFTFIGDDDVFVYINNQRVIDLGGVHNAETQRVSLDTLGLTLGSVYPISVFQAERHTSASHFRIDTTLAFTNCGEVPSGIIVN